MSDDPNHIHRSNRVNETSESLILRLKQNQVDAWQRLDRLYSPLVRFWCRKQGAREQDIPDLVQDVFQTVAKSIDSFSTQHESGSFRGWLRTITRSRVIDWNRRMTGKPQAIGGSTAQGRLEDLPFDPDRVSVSGSEANSEEQLTQMLYANALTFIRGHFRERTWQAFLRVVVEGKSPSQVAEELDMKPGAVRVAKSRVLHRLRAELGESIEEA